MYATQTSPVPGLAPLTFRDLANALVAGAVRNGFIESLHAGAWSPLLTDPGLSRIIDAEMKRLMVETSAELAYLLRLLLEDPAAFEEQLRFLQRYTRTWEREALTADLPEVPREVPSCSACGASTASSSWRFCPACGAPLASAT